MSDLSSAAVFPRVLTEDEPEPAANSTVILVELPVVGVSRGDDGIWLAHCEEDVPPMRWSQAIRLFQGKPVYVISPSSVERDS